MSHKATHTDWLSAKRRSVHQQPGQPPTCCELASVRWAADGLLTGCCVADLLLKRSRSAFMASLMSVGEQGSTLER